MARIKTLLKRSSILSMIGLVLVVTALVPAFTFGTAHAAGGMVTSRSLTMSSSTAGASGVTYSIAFTAASSYTFSSMVIDFCGDSPISGYATCLNTYAFSIGTPTVTAFDIGSVAITGTWAATKLNSNRTLVESCTASCPAVTSASNITLNITTVTNPNTINTTFYARIYTYVTNIGSSYTLASPGTIQDYGGLAMSTGNAITITSKVQEQLTMCIYLHSLSCATQSGAAISILLGDTHDVLSSAGPFVDNTTQMDVSTNALNAATVYLKGTTLTNGTQTINGMGNTAVVSAPTTSQFGICGWVSAGSSGTLAATYNSNTYCNTTTETAGTGATGGAGTTPATFGFGTNVNNGTTGDLFLTETAGTTTTFRLAFIANIAATQASGIYTSNLQFIGIGSY